jgi:hypothetical protein
MKYKLRTPINKIPSKRIAEYVDKVKFLLSPFPKEDRDYDFYIRKAEELYLQENVM